MSGSEDNHEPIAEPYSQYRAQSKVGVCYISTHSDGTIPVRGVLLENGREEVELFPDGSPRLLTLSANECGRRWDGSCAWSEMSLASLRETLVC